MEIESQEPLPKVKEDHSLYLSALATILFQFKAMHTETIGSPLHNFIWLADAYRDWCFLFPFGSQT